MADVLMTFENAQAFLAKRRTVPTTLGSRELSLDPSFPAQARAQALYSARVSSANVLEKLREEISNHLAGGEGGDSATMRLRMKRFLSAEGYQPDDVSALDLPDDPEEAARIRELRSVQNLASTRRLDLIFETNAKQAQASARRAVDLDPDVAERWPYYRYDALSDARDTHAALDGLVLRKDDPFWDSHTPPWEFGCRCAVYNADEEDAARAGGVTSTAVSEQPNGSQDATVQPPNGLPFRIAPNQSGYVFRVDQTSGDAPTFNFKAVKSDLLRPLVEAEVKAAPVSTVSTVYDSRLQTMTADLKKAGLNHLSQHLEKMPRRAVEAVAEAPRMFAAATHDKGAYYMRGNRGVYMKHSGWSGHPRTLWHEYGHHLHYELDVIDNFRIDAEFAQAVSDDVAAWKKARKAEGIALGKTFKAQKLTSEASEWLAKRLGLSSYEYFELPLDEKKILSQYLDVVGGATGGAYGAGHSISYYKSHNKGAMEVFANVFSWITANEAKALADFPKTAKYIQDLLK